MTARVALTGGFGSERLPSMRRPRFVLALFFLAAGFLAAAPPAAREA